MKTEQRVINRVIKFRALVPVNSPGPKSMEYFDLSLIDDCARLAYADYDASQLMQFTGKHCFNNREVYEGDILFYEQQEDGGDVRYYLVVAWIEEWSMFATLHRSEYNMYLISGAEALDEGLFWTYTLEGCKDYHYAGNIYENPELLND